MAKKIIRLHFVGVNLGGINTNTLYQDYPADEITQIVSLNGASAKVGRKLPGDLEEFYIKNYQGSAMRTVSREGDIYDGWIYDYLSDGQPQTLRNKSNEEVVERYTGKEYDKVFGMYYYGARFYDPEVGMWLSKDPAMQFFNPYSNGGDFVNYVDPNGLWTLGLGFVVGYDSRNGWHWGFGAAADFSDEIGVGVNASHVWNENGFQTSTVGVQVFAPLGPAHLKGGIGYSNNDVTGSNFNWNIGAGLGSNPFENVGVEVGGSYYWDRSGNYMGGYHFAGIYTSYYGLSTRAGHQWGHGGFNSGGYIGGGLGPMQGNIGPDGSSWGFDTQVASYTLTNEKPKVLVTETSDWIGHSAIVDENGNSLISFGPDHDKKSYNSKTTSILGLIFGTPGDNDWSTYNNKTKDVSKMELYGLNSDLITAYSDAITGNAAIPYTFLGSSCSFHAGYGLLFSSNKFLPGMISPRTLEWNSYLHQGTYVDW